MHGDLADAIRRDLLTDQLQFDDLGWRGLWAYITAAPPGTAIFYAISKGWTLGEKLAAETLTDLRSLLHRYVAAHFVGGTEAPLPEPINYPGRAVADEPKGWETATIDDLLTPEVKALLEGD